MIRREVVQHVLERGNDHAYNYDEYLGPEEPGRGPASAQNPSRARAQRERERRVREAMQSVRAN